MRKVRGIVALVIAVVAGLLAARGVGYVLNRSHKPVNQPEPVKAESAATRPAKLVIPEGLREVAIEVNEVTGVSRELKPGDIVDVLTIVSLPDRKKGSVARMLIENATVYRVGGGRTEVVKRLVTQKKNWTVSLLLQPSHAAVLLAATKSAEIALVVRQGAQSSGDESRPEPELSRDGREYMFLGAGGIRILGEEDQDRNRRIPENMRAISIEIDASDGIQGVFRTGDRVDVIFSSPMGVFNSQSNLTVGSKGVVTEKRAMSVMLLQDVPVLGAEDIVPLAQESRKKVRQVTLALSPQNALKLSSALDAGGSKARIRLVSRHPDDRGHPPLATAYVNDILTRRRESRRVTVVKGTARNIIPFYK